jgi:hypothetical protein
MTVAANFLTKLSPDVRRNVFRHMLQREYKPVVWVLVYCMFKECTVKQGRQ